MMPQESNQQNPEYEAFYRITIWFLQQVNGIWKSTVRGAGVSVLVQKTVKSHNSHSQINK